MLNSIDNENTKFYDSNLYRTYCLELGDIEKVNELSMNILENDSLAEKQDIILENYRCFMHNEVGSLTSTEETILKETDIKELHISMENVLLDRVNKRKGL